MTHYFNVDRGIQAAGVLLRSEDGKMESLRLLILLYIADRESLQETGRPITSSTAVAMEHGPLSSEVFDLIKGLVTSEARWAEHIRAHGHSLQLISDPGRGKLSKYEIEKLNDVSQRHEHQNTWELVRLVQQFAEWLKNAPVQGQTRPIPTGDIIDAVGRSADKTEILADLKDKAAYDRFFEGARSESRGHVLVEGSIG